jgi:hypothetical protein
MVSIRKANVVLAAATAALLLAAAPPLFKNPTESKWAVTSGGKTIANITVLTDGRSVRSEWKPAAGATIVFIGTNDKLWARESGGDVELANHRGGAEKSVLPALMLPFTTKPTDKVDSKDGKIRTYSYTGEEAAIATYTYDATGANQIEVNAGTNQYTLKRTGSAMPKLADASIYVVHPRKGAVTQISRLAGDLFAPSDAKVSATAGGRGVTPIKALNDGGDYEALKKLEERDAQRTAKLSQALTEFQKEGKVGQGREN